jgi:hypothetical protein
MRFVQLPDRLPERAWGGSNSVNIIGDYSDNGYAQVQGLISPEVATTFLALVKDAIGPGAIPLSRVKDFPNLLQRPALEIYGFQCPPMLTFLWGLTPVVSSMAGKDLLPSYDYFRVYRAGDRCRVHFDRPWCEHSLSLTLAYSDGKRWPLMVGKQRHVAPNASVEETFGDEPFTSIPMSIGDAVLYRGTNHRHGLVEPNPNGWSAHLFLHWVERGGPYEEHAFDGRLSMPKLDFQFAWPSRPKRMFSN